MVELFNNENVMKFIFNQETASENKRDPDSLWFQVITGCILGKLKQPCCGAGT